MDARDLLRRRFYSQQLSRPRFSDATELVAWFGAVQAQEYRDALWSVGQRLRQATEAAVEQAFNAGAILRTHVMRPTWHFVAPADIRWLLALTAPRVHQFNAAYYRKAGLDAASLKRCHTLLARALQGGQTHTRVELQAALEKGGIKQAGLGLSLVMMHAELEGLICSGPRRGKQFTYALLEERVPPEPARSREEALAELVRRYFQAHGPATPHDFAWWSGLTVADARAGLALAQGQVEQETFEGKVYWFVPARAPAVPERVYLLPTYDEYGIAYKDRSALYSAEEGARIMDGFSAGYPNTIVTGGRALGLWRREFGKDTVTVSRQLWRDVTAAEERALAAAAERYGDFLGLPVTLA